jgi:Tol biopolymer transport system component
MNDSRVDALIKRLDVEPIPPRGAVESMFDAISNVAVVERRRSRQPWWRLLGRLRTLGGGAAGPWPMAAPRRMLVLLATVALTALLVWASLFVAGQRSPDPPWVPNQVVFGRFNGSNNAWDILAMRADGTGERSLLAGAHDVTRVSHDGKRIATATIGEIVFPTIWDVDGTKLLELHPDPTLNLGAMAWSHDDQWLAFEAWDDTNPARDGIYLMRVNGTELRRLTTRGIPGDFSPDGTTLVFSREGAGLFLINVDGTNERRVGDATVDGTGFLPDGRSIYAAAGGELQRIDPVTGDAVTIAAPAGTLVHPRITPDGSRFVFALTETGGTSRGIWTVAADGTGLKRLVDVSGLNEGFPDWLP